MLCASVVSKLLQYNQDTGQFLSRKNGKVVGHLGQDGYWILKIQGKNYTAHRVAWLVQTGSWPEYEIDHRNCVRDDNRWSNLRAATHSQNQANGTQYKNNRIGLKGVSPTYYPPGRFRARIRKDGKEIFLGVFVTAQDAHAAYVEAAKKLHGEFWRAK